METTQCLFASLTTACGCIGFSFAMYFNADCSYDIVMQLNRISILLSAMVAAGGASGMPPLGFTVFLCISPGFAFMHSANSQTQVRSN